MSLFWVGGNAGFALAPILITPAVLVFGLSGTVVVAILPALVAVALAFELPHLKRRTAGAAAKAAARGARPTARTMTGVRSARLTRADRGPLGDLLRPPVLRADVADPRVRR